MATYIDPQEFDAGVEAAAKEEGGQAPPSAFNPPSIKSKEKQPRRIKPRKGVAIKGQQPIPPAIEFLPQEDFKLPSPAFEGPLAPGRSQVLEDFLAGPKSTKVMEERAFGGPKRRAESVQEYRNRAAADAERRALGSGPRKTTIQKRDGKIVFGSEPIPSASDDFESFQERQRLDQQAASLRAEAMGIIPQRIQKPTVTQKLKESFDKQDEGRFLESARAGAEGILDPIATGLTDPLRQSGLLIQGIGRELGAVPRDPLLNYALTTPRESTVEGLGADLLKGLGSTGTFALASVIGGGPLVGAYGALSNAGQVYEEALKSGFSNRQALLASIPAALVGYLERFGFGGKGLEEAISNSILHGALEEGGQEVITAALNNINARILSGYDPNRAIAEGVLESGLMGAILGGGIPAGAKLGAATAKSAQQLVEMIPRARIKDAAKAFLASEEGSFDPQRTAEKLNNLLKFISKSKVVNKAGDPIPVYHGTQSPRPIEQVDMSKLDPNALYGPGFYTTQDPEVAAGEGGYATTKAPSIGQDEQRGMAVRARDILREELAETNIYVPDHTFLSSYRDFVNVLRQRGDVSEDFGSKLYQLVDTVQPRPRPQAYKLYLDIRNPLDIDSLINNDKVLNEIAEDLAQRSGEATSAIRQMLGDTQGGYGPIGYFPSTTGGNLYSTLMTYLEGGDNRATKADINDYLKQKGFDGITHIGGSLRGTPGQTYLDRAEAEQQAEITGGTINERRVSKDSEFADRLPQYKNLVRAVMGLNRMTVTDPTLVRKDAQILLDAYNEGRLRQGGLAGEDVSLVADEAQKYIQDYDSFVPGNRYSVEGHRVWIAFSPSQVKSATGNKGDYKGDPLSIRPSDTSQDLEEQAQQRGYNIALTQDTRQAYSQESNDLMLQMSKMDPRSPGFDDLQQRWIKLRTALTDGEAFSGAKNWEELEEMLTSRALPEGAKGLGEIDISDWTLSIRNADSVSDKTQPEVAIASKGSPGEGYSMRQYKGASAPVMIAPRSFFDAYSKYRGIPEGYTSLGFALVLDPQSNVDEIDQMIADNLPPQEASYARAGLKEVVSTARAKGQGTAIVLDGSKDPFKVYGSALHEFLHSGQREGLKTATREGQGSITINLDSLHSPAITEHPLVQRLLDTEQGYVVAEGDPAYLAMEMFAHFGEGDTMLLASKDNPQGATPDEMANFLLDYAFDILDFRGPNVLKALEDAAIIEPKLEQRLSEAKGFYGNLQELSEMGKYGQGPRSTWMAQSGKSYQQLLSESPFPDAQRAKEWLSNYFKQPISAIEEKFGYAQDTDYIVAATYQYQRLSDFASGRQSPAWAKGPANNILSSEGDTSYDSTRSIEGGDQAEASSLAEGENLPETKSFVDPETRSIADLSLLRSGDDFIPGIESGPVYFFNRLQSNDPGKGGGTKVLRQAIDFSNQTGIPILNHVSAYGNLSQENLVAYYIRNGFERVDLPELGGEDLLIYRPKSSLARPANNIQEDPLSIRGENQPEFELGDEVEDPYAQAQAGGQSTSTEGQVLENTPQDTPTTQGPSNIDPVNKGLEVWRDDPFFRVMLNYPYLREIMEDFHQLLREGGFEYDPKIPPSIQLAMAVAEGKIDSPRVEAKLREHNLTWADFSNALLNDASESGRHLNEYARLDRAWGQMLKDDPERAKRLLPAKKLIQLTLKDLEKGILGRSLWNRSGDTLRKMALSWVGTAASNAWGTGLQLPLRAATGYSAGILQAMNNGEGSILERLEKGDKAARREMQASVEVILAMKPKELLSKIRRQPTARSTEIEDIIGAVQKTFPEVEGKLHALSSGLEDIKQQGLALDLIRTALPQVTNPKDRKLFEEKLKTLEKREKFNQSLAGKAYSKMDGFYEFFLQPNIWQEYFFRRPYFVGQLDAELARRGHDLRQMIADGRAHEIPEEAVNAAIDAALEVTWAYDPKSEYQSKQNDPVGKAVENASYYWIKGLNRLGGPASFAIEGFPKNIYNGIKFFYEYGPLGFLHPGAKMLRPSAKFDFQDYKRLSSAALGSALYFAAGALRQALGGEEWWQIKTGRKSKSGRPVYLDARRIPALSTFLWLSDRTIRVVTGRASDIDFAAEAREQYLSMRRAGDIGSTVLEALNATLQHWGEDSGGEGIRQKATQAVGQQLALPLRPMKNLQALINQFSEQEALQRDRREGGILGPSIDSLPWVRRRLPVAESLTQPQPFFSEQTPLSSPLGLSFKEGETFAGSELRRLGISPYKYLKRDADPKIDRLQASTFRDLLEEEARGVEQDPSYQRLSTLEKKAWWEELISESGIIKEARDAGLEANPEEAEKRGAKRDAGGRFRYQLEQMEEKKQRTSLPHR